MSGLLVFKGVCQEAVHHSMMLLTWQLTNFCLNLWWSHCVDFQTEGKESKCALDTVCIDLYGHTAEGDSWRARQQALLVLVKVFGGFEVHWFSWVR